MEPLLLAGALALVGAGSAFYHASLTFAGQTADVFGMYLVGTVVLLSAVRRRWPLTAGRAAALYLGVNGILLALLVTQPLLRRWLFAAVLGAGVALGLGPHRTRDLDRALIALAVGSLIWALDLTRVFCRPESAFQGHAIWHLLGATAAGFAARWLETGARAA
jgi:hypothetical protein